MTTDEREKEIEAFAQECKGKFKWSGVINKLRTGYYAYYMGVVKGARWSDANPANPAPRAILNGDHWEKEYRKLSEETRIVMQEEFAKRDDLERTLVTAKDLIAEGARQIAELRASQAVSPAVEKMRETLVKLRIRLIGRGGGEVGMIEEALAAYDAEKGRG